MMRHFKNIHIALALCLFAAFSFAACGGGTTSGEQQPAATETADEHAGHDHSGHHHDGHNHAGHDHSGHNHDSHDHSGHDHDSHAGHDHGVDGGAKAAKDRSPEYASAYVCPMHCRGSGSESAGNCPTCKMEYVANTTHKSDGHTH